MLLLSLRNIKRMQKTLCNKLLFDKYTAIFVAE